MAGLLAGSALQRTGRAVRSWLPFFAAIPVLVLIQDQIALNPALGLEYAFQNINHIGIRVIIENTPFCGGAIGLSPIPHRADFAWIWAVAIGTIIVAKRLRDSTHGRAFLSVREDEVAAEAMGIDTTGYKVRAFVISAFFAGVAGALSGAFEGNLAPQSFTFVRSFEVVAMVVLGGMGSITGATIAAAVLTILPEYLRAVANLRMVIYSIALIALMLLRPRGLLGTREVWDWC